MPSRSPSASSESRPPTPIHARATGTLKPGRTGFKIRHHDALLARKSAVSCPGLSSSLLHGARAVVAAPEAGASEESGLSGLDARIARGTPGFLLVHAESEGAARAVREYVVRRARASSALGLHALARPGAPLWHSVVMQLLPAHVAGRTQEPAAVVELLVTGTQSRARARATVIVAPLPPPRSWDRSVALELAARAHPFLVVFVSDASGTCGAADARRFDRDAVLRAEHFEVGAKLTEGERDTWWSVLASAAPAELGELPLSGLESWWTEARRAATSATPAPPRSLTEAEASLCPR